MPTMRPIRPAYKETAVKMELLKEKGRTRSSRKPRFSAKPTPQIGVEVERKWARKDYHLPGTTKLVNIDLHK